MIATIADELATLLAAVDYGETVEVSRSWRPELAPTEGDLTTARIEVIPGQVTPERPARKGGWQRRYILNCLVSRRVSGTVADTDEVVALAEAVATLLENTDVLPSSGAAIVSYAIDPFVVSDHLDSFRVATSLVRVEVTR